MRFRAELIVTAMSVFLSGCVSLSDYADPQTTGKVSPQARNWGAGCVGNGAKLTLGGRADQRGTFIVVAGDQPILKQAVAANDTVWVDIDRPILADPFHCKIQVKINGAVMAQADSTVGAYRAYFVPMSNGT